MTTAEAKKWAKDIYQNKDGSTDGLIADIAKALLEARERALEEAEEAAELFDVAYGRFSPYETRAGIADAIRALRSTPEEKK